MRSPARSLLLSLLLAPALAGEDLSDLFASLKGAENSVTRLVVIRKAARSLDPLDRRPLAAAYARLEADPASGFSEAEKTAILSAIRDLPEAGPCACRGLTDPSRAVRMEALRCVEARRHGPAVPDLIALLDGVGQDRSFAREDLALAQRAGQVLEILANRSEHFDALSRQAERQVVLTRWRRWWEANQARPRSEWVRQGFQDEGIEVVLAPGGSPQATPESVEPLLGALAEDRPAWIRENAEDLLSHASRTCWPALAKGLSHEDEAVRLRLAKTFRAALAAAGQPDLPDPAQGGLAESLKAWWGGHADSQ